MPLEKELETYRSKLPEIESSHGKYVLIQGDEIVGFFDTYADAMQRGYKDFGVEKRFLVKLVEGTETVQHITRLIAV